MKAFWSSIWDTVYLVVSHTSLTVRSLQEAISCLPQFAGFSYTNPLRLALECDSIAKHLPSMLEAPGSIYSLEGRTFLLMFEPDPYLLVC